MLKTGSLCGLIATALLLVVTASTDSQFIGSVEASAESGEFTTASIKKNLNEDFYNRQVNQSYLAQAGEQSSWIKVPGGARDIGIGGDGSVWVVGASENNQGNSLVYRRKDSEWIARNGYGIGIDVAPKGNPWIFNRQGEIFYLNFNNNQWLKVSGQARGIGIGGDGSVWILDRNPYTDSAGVFRGYKVWKWNGSGWNPYNAYGVAIDVAPGGTPWIINKQGEIFYLNLNNNQWIKVPGRARQIGIGGDGSVWVVGWDFNSTKAGYPIYRRTDSGWEFANAYGVAVDVAPGGTPWIANQRGEIFYSAKDLAAVDWCYFLNEAVPRIEFHPVIRNNGATTWRTDKEGKYRIVAGWSTGSGGWEEIKADYTLRGYPYWWLVPWKTEVLDNSITMPFSENRLYAFGSWELSHPEDSNPNNNRYSAPVEIHKGIAGKEFKQGGSMNNKKCKY